MTPAQFTDLWRAHFGTFVHPFALSLAEGAARIEQKPAENVRLCWDVLGGQAAAAFAIEVKRDMDGGVTSKIHLPTGMPSAVFRETAWHGRAYIEPFFVGEVISDDNRYCVLRLVFMPDGMLLEFFFGGTPRYEYEEVES